MIKVTVYVILVLLAMDPVKARAIEQDNGEAGEENQLSAAEKLEDNFAKTMAVLQSFDSGYDAVIQRADSITYYSAVDYVIKLQNMYKEVSSDDFIYHYIYFKHSGLPRKYDPYDAPVEPYVKAYVTYQAFLAAVNFKVCELYYRSVATHSSLDEPLQPSSDKRADMCHELFMLMHWFTFSCIKEKVRDFRDTGTRRFPFIFMQRLIWSNSDCVVSDATKVLSELDLDFIMDLDDLKNESRISREYKHFHSIIKWDKVPKTIKNVSENPLRLIHSTKQSTQKIYQFELPENLVREKLYVALYEEILGCFKDGILILEDFFRTTITRTSLPSDERVIETLIPEHTLSKKLWDRLPDFIKIKNNLDPREPRHIFGGIGDKMRRSNPTEIIRTILEITAQYQSEQTAECENDEIWKHEIRGFPKQHDSCKEPFLSKIRNGDEEIAEHENKIPEEEDSQREKLCAKITGLKAQPGCILPRNLNSSKLIDYYVVIYAANNYEVTASLSENAGNI